MRELFLLLRKDFERIWKFYLGFSLAYVVALATMAIYRRPEYIVLDIQQWTFVFSIVLMGGVAISTTVDERRRKTILVLLSLPVSLRDVVFSKFILQLFVGPGTYIILYLSSGVAVRTLYGINVFVPAPYVVHIVSGMVLLSGILIGCIFLFSPVVGYLVPMVGSVLLPMLGIVLGGLAEERWNVDLSELLLQSLANPTAAYLGLLGSLVVFCLLVELTWRILIRKDPTELAT